MKKNKIKFILLTVIIIAIIVATVTLIVKNLTTHNDLAQIPEQGNNINVNEKGETKTEEKIDIIDINSKSRPYAVVVNNTDVAVKVQEGLNKAYLVYEVPTEFNTSRLIAMYKDIKEDLVIGTIRSARHNFVDFALESDAIFCCFGWSHYAEDDLKSGSIDYLQGLFGYPYYRDNKENLALEHTAYTSMAKLKKAVKDKSIRTTSNNSVLLKYNVSDVELASATKVETANEITIPYGAAPQIASFKYNEETKMYTRYENGKKCKDHETKEEVTTKNIIIQKIDYKVCDDNYYWDLKTTGTGEGYYITNGYAIPITWSKSSRSAKTKYTYKSGTVINEKDVGGKEIEVSDGRTWIEVQTNEQNFTIK